MRIGTNSAAQNAVNRLNKVSSALEKNSNKLSSGSRITTAADDAAGLAVADSLRADRVLADAARENASRGTAAIAIAEGTLQTVQQIDIERAELAAQAANGANSPENLAALDAKYQALGAQREQTLASASFNGTPLFEGGGASFDLQVGTSGGSNDRISVSITSPSGSGGSLLTQDSARAALDASRAQVASTSEAVGSLGAFVSRLDVADSNLAAASSNYAAAESQIRDLDYAQALTERSNLQIQRQAAVAIAAQANQQPDVVARLLRT